MLVRVIQLLICFTSCLLAFTPMGNFISAQKALSKPASNPSGSAAVTEKKVMTVKECYPAAFYLLCSLIFWPNCDFFFLHQMLKELPIMKEMQS